LTRLPRDFLRRDSETVARALLGQRLVRVLDGQRLAGRIVETEAYLGVPDRAAHAYGGRHTARNASLYADGGTAYVYRIYGLHHCLNVVAGVEGVPVAVLLRALAPEEGIAAMRARRPAARRDAELCAGPGRLCAALGVDLALDGADLVEGEALFLEGGAPVADVVTGPRVGVDYAGEWARAPLRFAVAGDPHVSRPRPDRA
jgi:DNA-3-methyladenine glycosylase